MSYLETRRNVVHIEMLLHRPAEGGLCSGSEECGEWSMAHVAECSAKAVGEAIAKELEICGERAAKDERPSHAIGWRAAATVAREGIQDEVRETQESD